MSADDAGLRREAAGRLAALDESTRNAVMRLADSVHQIQDGTLGADEPAADRAAYRLGWLARGAHEVLEAFGLNEIDGREQG